VTDFLSYIYDALGEAGIFVLVALGITLVYGLTRLVNFAQGQIVALGAFVTYALVSRGIPLPVALVLSTVGVGLASELLEAGLFRRTVTRPFNGLVISLGLIVALEGAYALIWPEPRYSLDPLVGGVWKVGSLLLDKNRAVLIAIAIVISLILIVLLRTTQTGRGVRAIGEDRMATRVLGVPVVRLTALTFMVGSGLGALGGGLLATLFPFNAYSGSDFLLDGFAVAIVGGLGSIPGVIVAALVLAVSETLGGAYISLAWAPAVGLVAIVAMLSLRPHGIFRGTEVGETLGSAEAALSFGEDPTEVVPDRATRPGAWLSGRSLLGEVPRLTLIAGVVLLALAPLMLPTVRLLSDASYAAIIAIASYGVWFLFRYAGIITVVQASLMGIGAYTAGITAAHWGVGFWLQLLLAIVAAAAVALIVGMIALRTRGSYFLILLFALSQLTVTAMSNWQGLTGGEVGLIQPTPPTPFGGAIDFSEPRAFYWLALGFLLLTIFVTVLVVRSPFGRRLVTVRDNEELARSLGLNVFAHKLVAFVMAGVIAAVAGVLLLYQQSAVTPNLFGVFPSIDFILAMMIGGVAVLGGPALGAAFFAFLPELLGLGPNTTQLVDGILLVAVIVLAPRGLGGQARHWYYRYLARKSVVGREIGATKPASAEG
jgi:branched-chain amino acid transport system permease protein